MSVRAYSRDPSNAPENIPHTLYLDMSHFSNGTAQRFTNDAHRSGQQPNLTKLKCRDEGESGSTVAQLA